VEGGGEEEMGSLLRLPPPPLFRLYLYEYDRDGWCNEQSERQAGKGRRKEPAFLASLNPSCLPACLPACLDLVQSLCLF